ncbi:MAG: putative homocitrate synthase AksA [Promethearchaeota archaeon]|nr:MAG: putative homocitrate synthase AksA [Candidatus Lokiarchaeota archaeon]
MSYKFSKEELRQLLVDYNEVSLKDKKEVPSKVHIWDETLRDGEQSPTVYLTLDEKIHLAKLMDEIGVEVIAVGYPAVSETEKKIVKTIVNEDCKKASIVGIARPKKKDIDACVEADLSEIVVFMPISPMFMKTLKLTEKDELHQITSAINYAKDNGFKVNWVSEDGTRAEFEHIKNVFKTAIDAGAERIVLGDTVGVLTPQSASYLVRKIREEVISPLNKDVPMGIHTHNDFGLAVANTITGVFEGCTFPHTCINGYGERAGNAALEEVVTILERMNIDTGIDLTRLPELSEMCEEYFCLPISQYKPIVGEYAFSHESGLHIAAILAHPLTYEPINPKMVGRRRKFYLGKFSGSKSISHALKKKISVLDLDKIPEEVIKKIVNEVKSKHETKSKEEIRKSFHIIKNEIKKITQGVSDKEFFEIVNKYAQPYVPEDFKAKPKPKP